MSVDNQTSSSGQFQGLQSSGKFAVGHGTLIGPAPHPASPVRRCFYTGAANAIRLHGYSAGPDTELKADNQHCVLSIWLSVGMVS